MSNLKEALRDLQKSHNLFLTFEGELYHPQLLERTAAKIQLQCNKEAEPLHNFDYDALFDKANRFQKGFLSYDGSSKFTYREIVNLPFVLYRKDSNEELEKFIINSLNMLPKINSRILTREILV